MSIAVFGSINMDLVARAPRLPAPGETLTGYAFRTIPGGKGANQAVACARLGAQTFMVGRVGGDDLGQTLKRELGAAGVDHTNTTVDASVSSGVAMITVEDSSENTIVVIPGANGEIDDEDLTRLEAILEQCEILLLQLEIPLEMVVKAAKLAKEKGVTVILDPAPAQPLPEAIYPLLDLITPNETEAERLAGIPVKTIEAAARAAKILKSHGVQNAIVKMGSHGAYACLAEKEAYFAAFPVDAVDTVAAGDAFNGAVATAISEGNSLEAAIRWGLAGGALSVTKEGAQPSMPDRNSLLTFLRKQGF